MFAIGNPETTTLIRSITESIKANRMLIEVAHRDAPNGLADVSSFVCCVPSLPARQTRLLSRERVHSCWKRVRPEHLVTIGFLLQTNEQTNEQIPAVDGWIIRSGHQFAMDNAAVSNVGYKYLSDGCTAAEFADGKGEGCVVLYVQPEKLLQLAYRGYICVD